MTENGQDMPAAAPIGGEAAPDAQEGGQAASSTSAPARAAAPAPRHDLQGEAQAHAGTQAASSAPDRQRGGHGQRLQRRPRQAARAAQGAQEGGQQRPRSEAASEAREALERVLERRLELGSIAWSMPEFEAEARQKYALVRLIAEAATAGRQIRVNGCGLTGAQFWNEAQNINLRTASDVLERVERAEMRGTIGNLRAYTLAAIYNGCQLDRVMRQA